jgi:5-(carboxyamino)imidazole ribonucleotide synthase
MELCRFLLDMPLQEPKLIAPTIMKNVLGAETRDCTSVMVETHNCASLHEPHRNPFPNPAKKIATENHPNVYVHDYGKTISKPKRKMGHITFVNMNFDDYNRKWANRFVCE